MRGDWEVPSFYSHNIGMVAARIEAWLAEHLAGTDIFLVEIRVLPKARIQVFLDSDSGLTIDRCARISRYLEGHLEEEGLVPEHYNLEVSSPGVGQPLKLRRQYTKNIGRKVEVKMAGGDTWKGQLEGVTEDHIQVKVKMKDSETKKRIQKTVDLPFEAITSTKVLVTF